MKRKLSSVLTAMALCLGLLPGTAMAEELPSLLIQDTMVTMDNMDDVLGNGTVSTAYENGKWTIRLTNASLNGPISVNHTSDDNAVDADIILSGENTVTVDRDSASGISASANLTISGEGSLAVTSTGDNAAGIGVAGNLVVSGTEVSADAQSTAIYGDTVKIQKSRVNASSADGLGLLGTYGLEISGSDVSARSENSLAAASSGNIAISNSEVEASSDASMGINTPKDVEISGQSVVTGTNSSYSLCAMGSVFISGGEVNMTSEDEIAIYAAKQLRITDGADVTAKGGQGCMVVGAIGSATGGGRLLVDGAALHATASVGPGVMVDGEAAIQGDADVTAVSEEYLNSSYPGYGLLAHALTVDGSKVSASASALGGIYVGTRDADNPAGDMAVKGDSDVTAVGKNNCGITVEGVFSVEGGNVTAQSAEDHGINVEGTLSVLKGSVDAASEGYRGVNVGKLLDIRNGAAFHAKGGSYMGVAEDAVAVKKADGIQLGSLCVEQTGGTPGRVQISGKDATVFVDENGGRLQEVTITTDSADYTEVNAAISRIPEDLSIYTSESVAALDSAKNAVDWELPSAQQETVDGYAAAIEAAIAGLVLRPVEPGQIELKVQVEEGISQVPEGLGNIPELDAPAKLEAVMRMKITQTGVPSGNTAVYDVTLMVSTDGGKTWAPVTKENFPADGRLAVTLPYPKGTDGTYRFTVVHMFTTDAFGKTPGDTEMPPVTNTAQGLRFTVTGLSPVSVGWMAPQTEPGTSSSGGGRGGSGSHAITIEKPEHGHVAANRDNAGSGSTVILTVTPDSGYVLDALTVTDSRGNDIALADQGGGEYTFTMPGRAVVIKAAFAPLADDTQRACNGGADCPSRRFADLETAGAWYHEAVDHVLRNGLMNGCGGALFCPDENLSRAQFAQILFNKEGRPAVHYLVPYRDVEPGAWYTEAICWAAGEGIVGGYDGGMFGPDDAITREQLAAMLWRYAGSPAAADKERHFADADDASGYALEALRWAAGNGILNGCGDGRLAPGEPATRAQAAQMLMNFLKDE